MNRAAKVAIPHPGWVAVGRASTTDEAVLNSG